jgi:Na+/proline symporter
MATLDILIVAVYFVVVIGVGFRYARRAAKSREDYFLGGRSMHWLALSMSGSVSNFDITGTMWIVSIIFLLGMKSMWHHWMWGFLLGAFFLAYMGKWVRRSQVMTAAEWMKTRFGDGAAGRVARVTYAFMAVLTQASFIGYAYQGIGKFAAVYIPLEALAPYASQPWQAALCTTYEADVLATLIMSVTTLYVLLGGLYSVVVTDVIQTVVLTAGSIFIACLAWAKLSPELLAQLPDDFTSLRVPWRIPEFAGTDNAPFEFFGALVVVWVMKGLLLNAGGPGQMYDFQRFLAARSPAEASKVGAAWSVFLIVRWGMAMGIALLALTGLTGTTDAEEVMPLVLREFLPVGIRGLVIAGLLAAFMSTFSSTVNSAASFLVQDVWMLLVKPDTQHRHAIWVSYASTLLVVMLGLLIGFQGESIAQIWGWIMMALGAGVIVPNVLRWYWWRFNGWGYAWGTAGGVFVSLVVLFYPAAPQWVMFPAIVGCSLAGCLLGTWLTPPAPDAVLRQFYVSVRPFGLWGPIKAQSGLRPEVLADPSESAARTVLNVCLAMPAIAALYLMPMYLVGHWYAYAGVCAAVASAAIVALKFTWYDFLPGENHAGAE